eukprot:SAG22_NODE_174_length_16466_cov_34.991568_19_plen_322_part_00
MGVMASPSIVSPRIVIKGCEEYDSAAKRYVDYTHGQILRLVARASSARETTGKSTVMILCHDLKKEYLRGFLYHPYPIESLLPKQQLSGMLLAELVGGRIKDAKGARGLLQSTLFGFRVRENPDYYANGGDCGSESDGASHGDLETRVVQKAVRELLEASCVVESPDGLLPTLAGQTAAEWGLCPSRRSVAAALLLQGDESPDAVMELLATAGADCIRARYSDAGLNQNLLRRLPAARAKRFPRGWPMGQCKAKAWLILAAGLEGTPLPTFEYVEDQRNVAALVKYRLLPAMTAILVAGASEGGDKRPPVYQVLQQMEKQL